jgi:site-specific DNA-methyltransferase (adenine-specific)
MYLVNKQIRLIRSIEDMKIDVVVGNPPYNNDIYLDFVTKAHEWTSNITCMITPAKWQAKGGKKNEQFRADIVPHMSKIVYYADAGDVFDIALSGGIAYYVCDNDIHNDKNINNRVYNNWNIKLGFNITEDEISIINKINNGFKAIINRQIKPTLGWNCMLAFGGDHYRDNAFKSNTGYFLVNTRNKEEIDPIYIKRVEDTNMYQVINGHYANNCATPFIIKPKEVATGDLITLYASTDINEVQSAKSYYECRLIWWLVKRFFGQSSLNTNSFSFVPDPGAFDHIFTDEELYKKYNLTPEEINIIESVIKERK